MSPVLGENAPLVIVLNQGSGSSDSDEVETSIRNSLQDAGRLHEIIRVDTPERLPELAERAVQLAASRHGAVVVVGGDGTINAVAQAVLPSGVPFGVLPQGTFNFFGRSHGLPEGAAGEGVLALLQAREKPVQVGMVNGVAFLVNASLGLYPELLEQREGAKRLLGRNRWVAIGSGVRTLLGRFPKLHLSMLGDAPIRELDAMTLVVGNNRLQLEKIGVGHVDAPESGRLTGIAVRPVGRLALLLMGARGLLGHLGDADRVESFAFSDLNVRVSRRERMKVAVDGEIRMLDLPLRFQVASQPLRLLVPTGAVPEQHA